MQIKYTKLGTPSRHRCGCGNRDTRPPPASSSPQGARGTGRSASHSPSGFSEALRRCDPSHEPKNTITDNRNTSRRRRGLARVTAGRTEVDHTHTPLRLTVENSVDRFSPGRPSVHAAPVTRSHAKGHCPKHCTILAETVGTTPGSQPAMGRATSWLTLRVACSGTFAAALSFSSSSTTCASRSSGVICTVASAAAPAPAPAPAPARPAPPLPPPVLMPPTTPAPARARPARLPRFSCSRPTAGQTQQTEVQ